MEHEGGTFKIGSLNAGTANGRITDILDLAVDNKISILCAQESRVGRDSEDAIKRMAKARGRKAFFTSCSKTGSMPHGGLIVFPSLPAKQIAKDMLHAERMLFLKVHRPGNLPLYVANVHLDPNGANGRRLELDAITQHFALKQGDKAIIGDFNNAWTDTPVAEYLATGMYRACESELDCADFTHRSGHTWSSHIDYMITTPLVACQNRASTIVKWSDHKLIMYDILTEPLEPIWRRKPAVHLDDEQIVSPAAWHRHWQSYAESFAKHIRHKDIIKAWGTLSGAMEDILASGLHHGPRRATPADPVQIQCESRHADRSMPLAARRF